jgi:hypothetical protein
MSDNPIDQLVEEALFHLGMDAPNQQVIERVKRIHERDVSDSEVARVKTAVDANFLRRTFLYDNYVTTLASDIEAEFRKIRFDHNFDAGDELEFAMCRILRQLLPQRFGVCRGFVVDAQGNKAGDDIIIYDRWRFPRLRTMDESSFAENQYVPIEAVCAYIEAKYTLNLEGDDGQSLAKALRQVAAVKSLCASRTKVSPHTITPYFTANPDAIPVKKPEGFPDYRNPPFALIWARQVRRKQSDKTLLEDREQIRTAIEQADLPSSLAPDVVVLGRSNLLLPLFPATLQGKPDYVHASPFFIDGKSRLEPFIATDRAFGIAMCYLFWVLDWILLDAIKWRQVIADSMGHVLLEKRLVQTKE